jgi:HEAT repeat protein
MAAAKALGKIGPQAKNAVPALMELLKDKESNVQKAAAEALRKIQEEKSREIP